jgi:hypothetical protein
MTPAPAAIHARGSRGRRRARDGDRRGRAVPVVGGLGPEPRFGRVRCGGVVPGTVDHERGAEKGASLAIDAARRRWNRPRAPWERTDARASPLRAGILRHSGSPVTGGRTRRRSGRPRTGRGCPRGPKRPRLASQSGRPLVKFARANPVGLAPANRRSRRSTRNAPVVRSGAPVSHRSRGRPSIMVTAHIRRSRIGAPSQEGLREHPAVR